VLAIAIPKIINKVGECLYDHKGLKPHLSFFLTIHEYGTGTIHTVLRKQEKRNGELSRRENATEESVNSPTWQSIHKRDFKRDFFYPGFLSWPEWKCGGSP
jgi:hypothetical protein